MKFDRRNKEVGTLVFHLSFSSLSFSPLPPSLTPSPPKMPGYCRKTEEGWVYSSAAIELVKSFMEEFPAVFDYLQYNPKADKYYESELMPAYAEG